MGTHPAAISIDGNIEIPMSELRFTTTRSSGPGGQNVNKVETRVILSFDLAASPSLSPELKSRIGERLATRVSKAGILRVTAQRHRSQAANRQLVLERFVALLNDALAEEAPRQPTLVPRRAKQKRLDEKHRRSEVKRRRSGDFDGES